MEVFEEALAGYREQTQWAAEANVTTRTVDRYRAMPDGLPFLKFGGRVYIPVEEAREWLRARIQRPNQRRRA
jgi:hypothetical protein